MVDKAGVLQGKIGKTFPRGLRHSYVNDSTKCFFCEKKHKRPKKKQLKVVYLVTVAVKTKNYTLAPDVIFMIGPWHAMC